MAKDSGSVGVPFDSAPLVPEDQGGSDIQVSKLSNLQALESFYAERMEMLSRTRQRYLTQNKILNTQINFENALMAATSFTLANVMLSGCDTKYVVQGIDNIKVQENQSSMVLTNLILQKITGDFFGESTYTIDPSKYTVSLNDPSGNFEIRDGQVALKQGVSLDYESLQAQGVDFFNISITITSNGGYFQPIIQPIKITVLDNTSDNINYTPADITLPTNIIQEGVAGFQLGKLVVTDPNVSDTFTFTLAGENTARTLFINNNFEVVNGVLKLKDGKSLVYNSLDGATIKNSNGDFVIKVTATDQDGASFTKEFNIILNDKPNTVNDTLTVNEDAFLSTINPLANDTDLFGQNLNIIGLSGFGTNSNIPGSVIQYVDPSKGYLLLNPATGIITYGLHQNFNGSFTFSYTVQDDYGGTNTATVTVTVNPINDAPFVPARTLTIGEDSAQTTGNVLTGASDPEGDPFIVRFFTFNGVQYSAKSGITVSPVTVAGIGTFNMAFGGQFAFTPAANFNGIVPITFVATDNFLAQTTSTLTITVQPINDNPVAPQVSVSTNEDTAISGDILPGDFRDVDGDIVKIAGYTFAGLGRTAGTSAFNPNVGTFVLNADGTYTFTPAANFNGIVTVTFAVIDGVGGGDSSGKLTITVNAINDNPVIPDTTASIAEDNALTGNVIPTGYKDVDGDFALVGNYRVSGANVGVTNVGDTLTITQDVRDASGAIVNTITVGTLVIQQNGQYIFTPEDNFNGPVPLIIVTFADGHGGFDEALLNITVTPVNDAPANLIVPNSLSVSENILGALIGTFNFVDPDKGDTFTYTLNDPRFFVQGNQIFLKGTEFLNYETENADGDPTIPLTLTVTDAGGLSTSASFTVRVFDQNDPLTVVNDSVIQDEGTSATVTGNVLDNDFDEDGVAITNLGLGGKNGILIPGFYIDGVTAESRSGPLSTLISGDIIALFPGAGDVKVENFYKEDSTVTIPNVGTFTMDDDGSYIFTPLLGFTGQVPTIHYAVLSLAPGTPSDIEYLLTPFDAPTLNITINATGNQVPTANPDTASGDEDAGNITGNLIANDTDTNGDTLFVTKFSVFPGTDITVHQNGSTLITIPEANDSTLTIHSNGDYTFAPSQNYFTQFGEPVIISYTISDGKGGTSSSTLKITVDSVPDTPVVQNDEFTSVGGVFSGNVITGVGTLDANHDGIPDGKDIDLDGSVLTVTKFSVGSQVFDPGEIFTQDNGETQLTINASGDISGVLASLLGPLGHPLPPITYTVMNGNEVSADASVTIV